jgi:hypothetical protein
MNTVNVFLPITKVDEAKRLVYGRAAHEVIDHSDEVFDYKSSKQNFINWSKLMHTESGGKSFGNIRGMHSNIAAGKVAEPLKFNDAEKAIDIVAKVVDDNEWQKVVEGVYTGFSMGGSYARKWADVMNGKSVTRYTANPNEVSLVDRPCIPTAKYFDIQKADGTVMRKMFKLAEDQEREIGGRFVGGAAGGATDRASKASENAADVEGDKDSTPEEIAAAHNIAARTHDKAAESHKKAATQAKENDNKVAMRAHNAMARFHTEAASAHRAQCGGDSVGKFSKSIEMAMLAGAVYAEANKGFEQPTSATTGIQSYDLDGQKKPKDDSQEKALSSPSSTEVGDGRVIKQLDNEDHNMADDKSVNKDAINSEGAKRGATVTNGTTGAGPESSNAAQGDPPDGQHGADRGVNGKAKKPAFDDMSDDEKDAACKMFKAAKAKEAQDAQAASEERIAKSVTNTVLAALQEAGLMKAAPVAKADNDGKKPALFAVGKDGKAEKAADGTDGDEKSLSKVATVLLKGEKEVDGANAATLIKSAHRKPMTHDQLFGRG